MSSRHRPTGHPQYPQRDARPPLPNQQFAPTNSNTRPPLPPQPIQNQRNTQSYSQPPSAPNGRTIPSGPAAQNNSQNQSTYNRPHHQHHQHQHESNRGRYERDSSTGSSRREPLPIPPSATSVPPPTAPSGPRADYNRSSHSHSQSTRAPLPPQGGNRFAPLPPPSVAGEREREKTPSGPRSQQPQTQAQQAQAPNGKASYQRGTIASAYSQRGENRERDDTGNSYSQNQHRQRRESYERPQTAESSSHHSHNRYADQSASSSNSRHHQSTSTSTSHRHSHNGPSQSQSHHSHHSHHSHSRDRSPSPTRSSSPPSKKRAKHSTTTASNSHYSRSPSPAPRRRSPSPPSSRPSSRPSSSAPSTTSKPPPNNSAAANRPPPDRTNIRLRGSVSRSPPSSDSEDSIKGESEVERERRKGAKSDKRKARRDRKDVEESEEEERRKRARIGEVGAGVGLERKVGGGGPGMMVPTGPRNGSNPGSGNSGRGSPAYPYPPGPGGAGMGYQQPPPSTFVKPGHQNPNQHQFQNANNNQTSHPNNGFTPPTAPRAFRENPKLQPSLPTPPPTLAPTITAPSFVTRPPPDAPKGPRGTFVPIGGGLPKTVGLGGKMVGVPTGPRGTAAGVKRFFPGDDEEEEQVVVVVGQKKKNGGWLAVGKEVPEGKGERERDREREREERERKEKEEKERREEERERDRERERERDEEREREREKDREWERGRERERLEEREREERGRRESERWEERRRNGGGREERGGMGRDERDDYDRRGYETSRQSGERNGSGRGNERRLPLESQESRASSSRNQPPTESSQPPMERDTPPRDTPPRPPSKQLPSEIELASAPKEDRMDVDPVAPSPSTFSRPEEFLRPRANTKDSSNLTRDDSLLVTSAQSTPINIHTTPLPAPVPVPTVVVSASTPQIPPPVIPPTELYERLVQVGEGTYGKVYKARNVETGGLVALKRIRMEAEKDGFPVTAVREIKLLQSLRHKNVVSLHEMMVSKGHVYMVFEYSDHDLTGVLHHPSISLSPAHLKSLMSQFLDGLSFIHRRGVLHRDLKGSNILLSKYGELKIADFGLARFYARGRGNDYTNRVITQWYKPPELLFGATVYGAEVDMWSAGCIFLELFARRPVFQGQDEIHQLDVIFKITGTPNVETWPGLQDLPWYELVKPKTVIESNLRTTFAKWLSPAGLDVAEALLMMNPAKRPTADEALEMEYFKEDPLPQMPDVLATVKGEWHEYESKRARKKQREEAG